MTNDGWGKSWTTQQAVDKAVEKLNVNEHDEYLKINLAETVKEKAKQDITNPVEEWGGATFNWNKEITDHIVSITPYVVVDEEFNKELQFLLAHWTALHLDSKIFTTEGLQVGDLVIWDEGDFFCISHVPTLSKFMKAVPTEDDKEYTNDQLVSWCVKVQQAYQEDWAKMRALTPANYATKDVEATLAAQRLKDWCLSVEI